MPKVPSTGLVAAVRRWLNNQVCRHRQQFYSNINRLIRARDPEWLPGGISGVGLEPGSCIFTATFEGSFYLPFRWPLHQFFKGSPGQPVSNPGGLISKHAEYPDIINIPADIELIHRNRKQTQLIC